MRKLTPGPQGKPRQWFLSTPTIVLRTRSGFPHSSGSPAAAGVLRLDSVLMPSPWTSCQNPSAKPSVYSIYSCRGNIEGSFCQPHGVIRRFLFLGPIWSYIYIWEKKHEFHSSIISDHAPSSLLCLLSTQKMLRILKGHIISIFH